MKRRSDALTALVAEVVDIENEADRLRDAADEARRESIAARQALDTANTALEGCLARHKMTKDALRLVQGRDDVSDETVAALVDRAAAHR